MRGLLRCRERVVRTPRKAAFNVRRPVALGFLTLLVLWGGLFGWGAFASISGAVIAAGRVEVETREQAVEHVDGGAVREILVREGDKVAAGQVLVRFDDKLLRTEEAILEAEAAELAARRNRLEAEFKNSGTIPWDAALAERAEADPAVADVLAGQARLFEARRSTRAGEEAQLRERVGQTRRQIAGLEAQAGAVKRQRGFLARELEAQRTLFEKRLTELGRLLELEREAARLDGVAGDIAARIAGARGRVAELEILILQIGAKRIEEAESGAREAQARENRVREQLAGVRARLRRLEVRAPVAGEVFAMTVFALGEVVRPGGPILKIVPEDAELVVRAQLSPIYVDQVWPGQKAVLRFSAFPARTTPQFEGRIVRVAADISHDPQSGLSWYEVEVAMGAALESGEGPALPDWVRNLWRGALDQLPDIPGDWQPERRLLAEWTPAWLGERLKGDAAPTGPEEDEERPAHARDLALAPGMPVQVHMRTGERSPLSYLAKPLTDYFSGSMREE